MVLHVVARGPVETASPFATRISNIHYPCAAPQAHVCVVLGAFVWLRSTGWYTIGDLSSKLESQAAIDCKTSRSQQPQEPAAPRQARPGSSPVGCHGPAWYDTSARHNRQPAALTSHKVLLSQTTLNHDHQTTTSTNITHLTPCHSVSCVIASTFRRG